MYNYNAPATTADINLFLRDIIFGKHVSDFCPGILFSSYTWGNGTRKFDASDAPRLDAHLATCRDLCATLGTSLAILSHEYTKLVDTAFTLRIGESQPVLCLGSNSHCFNVVCRGILTRTKQGYTHTSGGMTFTTDSLGYLPDTPDYRKQLSALCKQLKADWQTAVDAQIAHVRQLN